MASRDRDLEAIRDEAHRLTDESLGSSRRIVRLADETRQVGAATLEQLSEQGEQLRRIDQGMDKINRDTKQAEKHLSSMEKCCGLCVCPWRRRRNFEHTSKYAGSAFKPRGGGATDGEVVDAQPGLSVDPGMSARGAGAGPRTGGGGDYIKRVTYDAREDEINENLGMAHSIIKDLRAQATQMGEELDEQNELIDRINVKTDSNTARVKAANERAAGLLR